MIDTPPRQLTYAQAICEATHQALELDPSVFLVGQGTRGAGFIFGTVDGLFEKYGPKRVMEMPLSESAVLGICMGAALDGLRPLLVLQRADFLFLTLDQLINHASKWHFMFGGKAKVPLVIRCIVGKGWGQGPQHSQSLHSLCSHFPGLRVVFPSLAYEAKGLLLNSIFSDDPVVFFEGRPVHSRIGDVPTRPYTCPFGEAKVIKQGHHITLLNTSFLLSAAEEVNSLLEKESISLELIDLVSANPIDYKTLLTSVEKTGRLLILDTSWKTSGLSSSISAEISYRLFKKLKAPIEILTIPDYPTPTASYLEDNYYPTVGQIKDACYQLMQYP